MKLVGLPSKEQFDAITVKVEQVYMEWSAEACGQIPLREKIVSDFDQFLKTIDGCESESCVCFYNVCIVLLYLDFACTNL